MLIYLKVKKWCIMYLFLYYFIKQKLHPTFIDLFYLFIDLFILSICLIIFIYNIIKNMYLFKNK